MDMIAGQPSAGTAAARALEWWLLALRRVFLRDATGPRQPAPAAPPAREDESWLMLWRQG